MAIDFIYPISQFANTLISMNTMLMNKSMFTMPKNDNVSMQQQSFAPQDKSSKSIDKKEIILSNGYKRKYEYR